MFSALLTPAVEGNNCELHVPDALPSEKYQRHKLDWLSSDPQFWCWWFQGDRKLLFCRRSKQDPSVVQPIA